MAPAHNAHDVCRFAGDTRLRPAPGGGGLAVPHDHPYLFYAGRIDCARPGRVVLGFPGGSLRVRFEGAALTLLLRDHGIPGDPRATNYYDVRIDGAEPTLLEVSPQRTAYPLATGLGPGVHTLELFKRTESSPSELPGTGRGELLGLRLPAGGRLHPVAPRPRRLTFIGDSITCGYGNMLSTADPSAAHFTTRNENAHLAYGAIVADLLDAEYAAVAFSGRGLVRNYAGAPGMYVPAMYGLSVPDDPDARPWPHAHYVPDAVVVNLGSNDFSTPGVDRRAFVAAYTKLLSDLRRIHPDALLVAAPGPMLTDDYPSGTAVWTAIRADVAEAIAARTRAGDTRLALQRFAPHRPPFGEDYHPTVATHRAMATQLASTLRARLGWPGPTN